jgi:hypothetical protein
MVSSSRFDPRRYSPRFLFVVSVATLELLVVSFLVDVRIVLERPNYGDVTTTVRVLWRVVLGLATLGSFLIGVYNSVSREADGGPTRGFEIKGRNHDIDFHVHIGDLSKQHEADEQGTREEQSGAVNGTQSEKNADGS